MRTPKTTTAKTTTAKVSTAVAIPVASIAETVAMLEKNLEALGNLSGDSFKTGSNAIEGVIIKECKDISLLTKLVGIVELNRQALVLGQKILNIKTLPAFTASGCTMEEIVEDVKRQIGILTHSETADKIKASIVKLQEIMTKEDRRAAVMAEVAALGLPVL